VNRGVELAVTLVEVARVLASLGRVEAARRSLGPRPLLDRLRRGARRTPERDATGRRCLRRAIRWVDSCLPGGGNCYRRALLEMALDRGAAREPLAMGMSAQGERVSGHAWLSDADRGATPYEFVIRL
jgi:hypothetical protein